MMHDAGKPILHIQPRSFSDLDGIAAGFSRRDGGVSNGPYRSLNVGLSTGDATEHVDENRRRLFTAIGIDAARLVIAGQVHGADVLDAHEPGLYPGYDGLVTMTPGLTLCITSADCAAVLLADAEAGVVGACHSGWRGTVADIAGKTVARMRDLGARPQQIRAYISPCISVDHFEVGEEVARQFGPECVDRRTEWPRPHVDLKAAIGGQLVRAGLRGEAIEISPHCTYAETDSFYSYRAENGMTGRMMGFICLEP